MGAKGEKWKHKNMEFLQNLLESRLKGKFEGLKRLSRSLLE
jgi:hypothetical protein